MSKLDLEAVSTQHEEDEDELHCFDLAHWGRCQPAYRHFDKKLYDDLSDLGVAQPNTPSVYLIKFVDLATPGHPVLFKYVGSTDYVPKRMRQHLEAVWSGNSRCNGSLMMTSTGHKLFRRFNCDLSFFRVEILKTGISSVIEVLHAEERRCMIEERAFALYGEGGLNVVDPISYLYVLNGGVSLRHLQKFKFEDSWTCVDFVNNVILPLTKEKGVSYHDFLESHQDESFRDAYRSVPDFFVAPTCNNCLWKNVLSYLQSKSSPSRILKARDERPKYLHDSGDLYVFMNFLYVNLHKDRRPWPFAARTPGRVG